MTWRASRTPATCDATSETRSCWSGGGRIRATCPNTSRATYPMSASACTSPEVMPANATRSATPPSASHTPRTAVSRRTPRPSTPPAVMPPTIAAGSTPAGIMPAAKSSDLSRK